MAILKFRVYFEEDESVYRDVVIRHLQSFFELHEAILRSYEFDNKHKATFFRSNDHWQRGREISIEVYQKEYKAPPLIMKDTTIGTEIKIPSQKFIYNYDFNKFQASHKKRIHKLLAQWVGFACNYFGNGARHIYGRKFDIIFGTS